MVAWLCHAYKLIYDACYRPGPASASLYSQGWRPSPASLTPQRKEHAAAALTRSLAYQNNYLVNVRFSGRAATARLIDEASMDGDACVLLPPVAAIIVLDCMLTGGNLSMFRAGVDGGYIYNFAGHRSHLTCKFLGRGDKGQASWAGLVSALFCLGRYTIHTSIMQFLYKLLLRAARTAGGHVCVQSRSRVTRSVQRSVLCAPSPQPKLLTTTVLTGPALADTAG